MNTYNLLCGFIPATLGIEKHFIKYIKLISTDDWMRADIIYKDKVIFTIGNIPNKIFDISLEESDNKFHLVINCKSILSEPLLFYVTISVYKNNNNNNNFIETTEEYIAE